MALFKGEGRDMTFDSVSEGLNIGGLQAYIDFLQIEVVQKILDELDNVGDVEAKINQGWQGKSRDAFFTKFNNTIEKTKDELQLEFTNLKEKLRELALDYYEQDAKMLDQI